MEFIYTKDSGDWRKRKWAAEKIEPANQSVISKQIDKGINVFYFNIMDENGTVASSVPVLVNK